MPLSKFEANLMLLLRVKRASFSLFPLASSCSNDSFHNLFSRKPVGFPKYSHILVQSLNTYATSDC